MPAGPEFRVNSYTTGYQVVPTVALSADGGIAVAWFSRFQDGSGFGVFGQRYSASGQPRGTEFRVNTATTSDQMLPRVAAEANGDFVAVWSSSQNGPPAIYGQRYDAAGTALGVEFRVSSNTTFYQGTPAVASDATGNFIVVWQAATTELFGRRFDTAGRARGTDFLINAYTTTSNNHPAVASDASGNFVVAWDIFAGGNREVRARRFDAGGTPLGVEFQVNTYTTSYQGAASVASDATGQFIVAWHSDGQDGSYLGIYGQRYDSAGNPQGIEFRINTQAFNFQTRPSVASDAERNFVVAWASTAQDGSYRGVFAQRFDSTGTRRGGEFQVNTYTTSSQFYAATSSDSVGNFVVAWHSYFQDGSSTGVFAQRFGGLGAAALDVDDAGNRVLEPGETVDVKPAWLNNSGATQSFTGTLSGITGPPGAIYTITDGIGSYGVVPANATAPCTDCYRVSVSNPTTRPALHWDASALESILPDAQGQRKRWLLHVGNSFADVASSSGFYRFIEVLLHRGVTGGCSGVDYCPTASTTREQMAVFVLVAKEGTGYAPPLCTTPTFADVPASNPFCRWIEELARRAVVGGCGGGNYCPSSAVTREQMAVFVLRTLDPALAPPACGTPLFADVPASSGFCKWIEELARRGVVTGCGGGNYCPAAPVTREQMGVFISATFGLTLYGP